MSSSSKFSPAADEAKLSVSTSPFKQEETHSRSVSHIPQMNGSFEYTLKDWELIPHYPGEVTLSPPFTITPNHTDLWVLQVFPEGRDSKKSGNVTFALCNLADSTVRATCHFKMEGKDQCQEFNRETEPAKPFAHNSEWDIDTGLTFAEITNKDSDWLQADGSLFVVVEMTICGNPAVLQSEGLTDLNDMLEPVESRIPTLADDMLRLLDINSSIEVLESGQKIITANVLSDNLDLLWKSDITLASEYELIPCHKCILAARSPVFCEMLQTTGTNMKMFVQAGKLYVTKHVHPSVLKAFVYYLYSDHCDVEFLLEDDGFHLSSLLRAASKYQVKGLLALCSQYLITTLTVENAASRLALAHACQGTEKMQAATLHFIAMHSAEVTETEGFQKLDADLYRLVVGEMTTSPYTSLEGPGGSLDEGIEREASREGGVDESEQKATPQVVESPENRRLFAAAHGRDTTGDKGGGEDNHSGFNTPPSGSPITTMTGDVKCKTGYQLVPEVDPQQHLKHKGGGYHEDVVGGLKQHGEEVKHTAVDMTTEDAKNVLSQGM